jgi:hypothetical protein
MRDAPIDAELWEKAGLREVGYMVSGKRPPAIRLGFDSRIWAHKIFQDWIAQIGGTDEHDAIRIAIIEGNIGGMPGGHVVKIGGLRHPSGDDLMLSCFKKQFAKDGVFEIIPAEYESGFNDHEWNMAIRKRHLHFRRVEDLGPDDMDADVLQ